MTSILVVQKDPGVSFYLADALGSELAAEIRCEATGPGAAKAIQAGGFDLAIIDAKLAQVSGFQLAMCAAQKNIPSLLCSGDPQAVATLMEFDFPHLAKPVRFAELIDQAARAIAKAPDNIRQMKASLARLESNDPQHPS
jgi:DNA-binding NtrC family response regulator